MVNQNEYVSSHRRIACYDELGFIYMVSVHYLARNRTSFHLLKGNPYAVHNINRFCELYRPDYEFVTQQYYGSYSEHTWRYNGDCLDDEKIAYLDSLTQYKDIWVEVGLQTIHDETSKHLNRGHDYACFLEAIHKLSKTNCKICVHIINGLPYETYDMMIETAKVVGNMDIQGLKIHNVYV